MHGSPERQEVKMKLMALMIVALSLIGTTWAQGHGVNPSAETVWNWHTCSSIVFPSQNSSSLSR
jgi:hypothetical protein